VSIQAGPRQVGIDSSTSVGPACRTGGRSVPVIRPGAAGRGPVTAELVRGRVPRTAAGQQQSRVGLADQLRQLAGTGQQRVALQHRRGEHGTGLFEQRPDLLRPQAGQYRGVGVCPISARSRSQRLGAPARNSGIRFCLRDSAHHRRHRGHISRVAFQRGSRGRGISSTEEACPGPGLAVRRTGVARCRPGLPARRHAHVRIEASAIAPVATVTGQARREGHPRHEHSTNDQVAGVMTSGKASPRLPLLQQVVPSRLSFHRSPGPRRGEQQECVTGLAGPRTASPRRAPTRRPPARHNSFSIARPTPGQLTRLGTREHRR